MLTALILTLSLAAAAPDATTALAEARALIDAGRFDSAATVLQALADRHELAGAIRARAFADLAYVDAQLGRPDAALAVLAEGDRIARGAGDTTALAAIENARGLVDGVRGRSLGALDHFKQSLALALRAGSAEAQAAALNGLASWYEEAGDWTRALDYAQRAFDIDPAPSDRKRLRFLYRRGIAYFESGERDEAERSYLEGLALARRLDDARLTALMLGELGGVYDFLDHDRAKAIDRYTQALSIQREKGLVADEVVYRNSLGVVYRRNGELDAARREFEEALALADRARIGRVRAMLQKNIGQVLVQTGHAPEAERMFRSALEKADEANAARFQWETRFELGKLLAHSDPAQADALFHEAIDLLEAAHSNIALESFRAGALGESIKYYDLYDAYIDLLLSHDRVADAFNVSERARARVFLETLSTNREELARSAPPAFRDQEDAELQRISELQAALRTGGTAGADRRVLTQTLETEEQALTALRLRLAIERPALAAARYPRLWTIAALQQQVLRDDELWLVYFLGATRSVCWAITRDTVRLVNLEPRGVIEPQVRRYLDALRSPRSDVRAAAAPLWHALGLDRAGPLPSQLVVVPHGILHYAPFDALVAPDGRFLVEEAALTYGESASTAAQLRESHASAPADGPTLVAIGDPTTPERFAALTRAGVPQQIRALGALAYAREELRAVVASAGWANEILERESATEHALADPAVARASVLHFATHAIADDAHPDRSALALTPRPPDEDGILQVREIYRLRLEADLVTLSACETAVGRDIAGEGLVGLSRAFYAAGARSVLASLWNVDDEASVAVMREFYTRLGRGAPIDRALREAKLTMLARHDAFRHPYYWAPFIVSGQTREPIGGSGAHDTNAPALPTLLIGVMSVCALMTVAFTRRRADSSPA